MKFLKFFPKWSFLLYGVFVLICLVGQLFGGKLIIYNPTPSLPKGFYIFTDTVAQKHNIVAFSVPAVVKEYLKVNYSKEGFTHFIKPVVATEGDLVCSDGKHLEINGQTIADVADKDSHNNLLPKWIGCGELAKGQYFVFSDRVKESFDSRYFGPITDEEIIGVYQKWPFKRG